MSDTEKAQTGRPMLAAISLGCAKNRIDTEEVLGYLAGKGFILTDDYERADVIFVNTCSFIDQAQQESVNTLLELTEQNIPGGWERPRIVAAGCLVEIYGDKILEELPFVDGAIGVHSYFKLDRFIDDLFKGKRPVFKEKAPKKYSTLASRVLTTPVHSANLKIAEGCSNRCHYCLIPTIRGPYRSRNPEDIVDEARYLAKLGAREINIIAQDTTAYGMDCDEYPDLAGLLKKILKTSTGFRLRIMYTYPSRITDDLIDLIASEARICKYLDIPIQHCSSRVLKKMGRHYNKQDLEELFSGLHRKIPGLAMRTTLMIGYPGERSIDFHELLDFVAHYPFESLGAFTYSPQKNSPAGDAGAQVSKRISRKRYRQLMLKQRSIARGLNEKKIGERINVLVDGALTEGGKWYCGKSEFQAPEVDGATFIRSKQPLAPGSMVSVRVRAVSPYNFIGINPKKL